MRDPNEPNKELLSDLSDEAKAVILSVINNMRAATPAKPLTAAQKILVLGTHYRDAQAKTQTGLISMGMNHNRIMREKKNDDTICRRGKR